MICQTCGAPTTASPALCDACLVERRAHGRAKARARAETFAARADAQVSAWCSECGTRLARHAGPICQGCFCTDAEAAS